MFYIHKISCISPQSTFESFDLSELHLSRENKMYAIEPAYANIPPGILRRMGKAVRMGVGAALPLLKENSDCDGIILGTANGGMEDCIKFLNQIIEYDEGALTPTNFVQSTTNAVASQIAFLTRNRGYNITHVHRGLSFENAMIDAMMHANEHPGKKYLLGGVDEISDYNFNIDFLGGWYKKDIVLNTSLYSEKSEGSIAGEGAAMFIVSGDKKSALACVKDVQIIHGTDKDELSLLLAGFLKSNAIQIDELDLFITGENGDMRFAHFTDTLESLVPDHIPVLRYKHATGEFPSAAAISVWIACNVLRSKMLPAHMLKRRSHGREIEKILLYNSYHGMQHSFILLTL